MTPPTVTPSQVRSMLLLREEIALLDLRHEAAFATGHPLFAANMAADRIGAEAQKRLPGLGSKPKRGCRARMCRSSSTTPAKVLWPRERIAWRHWATRMFANSA